ncbi:MAG: alpha-amylase family glycosyl hydrolase [Victivallaceae bacterium]|nr:alpha-amylase family glycosyl hydrolase [Victivallaceae bacterium]
MRERFGVLTGIFAVATLAAAGGIDNSQLLPKYRSDDKVQYEISRDGSREHVDWIKSLIMVEVRIDSASPDWTVKGMPKVLDHLAEMGVNGVWIPPLCEGSHYGNYGIHTVNARITGEKEPAKRWQALKNFVDEAHKRNIRVFFDVVSWGASKHAPLRREKPEWFGDEIKKYGGWLFDWKNPELREWFASRIVEWILLTGADGFRCDCAPFYCEYGPYETAKTRLRAMGRKTVFISEWGSARKNVFDFDQVSMLQEQHAKPRWVGDAFLEKNLVDMVKSGDEFWVRDAKAPSGRERFYTYMISCHDSRQYLAQGRLYVLGYQAILAPYIPLWYLGEEWNNPVTGKPRKPGEKAPWMYDNKIDWTLLDKPENRAFFESVKKLIRIRRSFPEIFEHFPEDHRDSNICKVDTDQKDLLQPYARYAGNKAVLVVPNNGKELRKFQISIPYERIGLDAAAPVTVKDLMLDRAISSGKLRDFSASIAPDGVGVYLVEGKCSAAGPLRPVRPKSEAKAPQSASAENKEVFAHRLFSPMAESKKTLVLWDNYAAAELLPSGGPNGTGAIRLQSSDAKGKTMRFVVPVAAVRGKTVRFSALVKAEDVKAVAESWKGVKLQIYATTADKKDYNQESMTFADRFGSYDWRKLGTTFQVLENVTYMSLSIGIYQTSGTVYFSALDLSAK